MNHNPLFHHSIKEGFTNPQSGFPSGYFKIRNRLNGKCLDLNGGSTNINTRVTLFNCHDGLNQHWYVDKLGRVFNRLANKALDLRSSNTANGGVVQIWHGHGGQNQRWYVDKTGHIRSKVGNKSLSFDEHNKNDQTFTYMWEDYNSQGQKWYFERVGLPKNTVELIKEVKLDAAKPVKNSRLLPTNAVTYQFWLRVKKFGTNWKPIYYKGNPDRSKGWTPRSPGLFISPNTPKFNVRCSTSANNDEGINPNYQIPKGEWINVAQVVNANKMMFYVNAKLVAQVTMKGHINPNNYDLQVGDVNSKNMELKFLEYSNYALSKDQIEHNMKLKRPSVIGKAHTMKQSIKQGVKIVNMSSNGTYQVNGKVSAECDPFRGQINQPSAWCAKERSSMKFYLQANFDQVYHVSKIYSQGRSTSSQWTTRYAVYYQNPVTDKWIRYGTTFSGNKDRNSIVTNKANFVTKSVRVYPQAWHGYPSMRIGFDGTTRGLSKCDRYLKESQDATTAKERKKYLKLYNSECRKITYQKHLQILDKQKDKYDSLYDMVDKYKNESANSSKNLAKLKKNNKDLTREVKKLKLDVEVAKAKKCPPQEKCLPVINPITDKKHSINDYDIRTHKDFHKYVLSTAVKPCNTDMSTNKKGLSKIKKELDECRSRFVEAFKHKKIGTIIEMFGGADDKKNHKSSKASKKSSKKSHKTGKSKASKKSKNTKKQPDDPYDIKHHKQYSEIIKNCVSKKKLSKVKKELSKCRSKFVESFTYGAPYPQMGGDRYLYGRACNYVTDANNVAAQEAKCIARFNKVGGGSKKTTPDPSSDPYDIRNHVQFQEIMKNYVLKSQCAADTKAAAKAAPSAKPSYKWGPIEQHPNYTTLMNKYALKSDGTCPSMKYMPCPPQAQVEEQKAQAEQHKKELEETQQKLKGLQDIQDDISKHPQFSAEQTKLLRKLQQKCAQVARLRIELKEVRAKLKVLDNNSILKSACRLRINIVQQKLALAQRKIKLLENKGIDPRAKHCLNSFTN